jgi:hypothetical protein
LREILDGSDWWKIGTKEGETNKKACGKNDELLAFYALVCVIFLQDKLERSLILC